MPIYRGSKLITPTRPGRTLERVYRGDRLTWTSFKDLKLVFTTVGTHVYGLPAGARFAEVICLGGGGGGQGGDTALGNNGDGGGAGQWGARTIDVSSMSSLTVVVGAGGAGGGKGQNGFAGRDSYVAGSGISTTFGYGGTLGTGWGNGIGDSVPSFRYGSETYYGGAGGARNNPGQSPGGGGGGGTGGFFGGGTAGHSGGNGRVLINLYGKEP